MAGINVGSVPYQGMAASFPVSGYATRPAPQMFQDPSGQMWDYVEPTGERTGTATAGRWVMRRTPEQQQATFAPGDNSETTASLTALWDQLKGMMPQMPRVQPPSMASYDAAQAAEFGKAKDTTGKLGEASMRSLRNQMQSRGISGSGIEAEGTANILGTTNANLGQVTRDQATTRLARKNAIDDMGYQGEISQRGQDLSTQHAFTGLLPSLLNYYKTSKGTRLY